MRRALAVAVLSVLVSAAPARAELINLGNGMIYDSVQDLTWLQDTLMTRTQGLDSRGRLTNTAAVEWVDNLTFGGYDDWRLPRMYKNTAGYTGLFYDSDSEISRLMSGLGWYWDPEVRNTESGYSTDQDTYYIRGSSGPFLGLENDPNAFRRYWVESNTPELSSCGTHCFAWFTSYELEYAWYHSQTANVWAVRSGMARVPEPSTLLAIGIGGLLFVRLRRRHTLAPLGVRRS